MSSICPKCGKFMEGDICERCQATEAAEKYNEKMKKKNEESAAANAEATESVAVPKKKLLPIIAVLIPVVILSLVVVAVNIKKMNDEKRAFLEQTEFVEQAKKDLSIIESAFSEGNYSKVMSSLESYWENYSVDSSVYSKELTENLYASTVCNEYETKIATKLYNDYEKLREQYANVSVMDASDEDIDGIQKLLNTISDLTAYFPNGFSYMDSNNTKVKFDDMKTLRNNYNDLSVKKGIALFNNGYNGEAIAAIKEVLNSEDLSDETRNRAQNCLNNMLPLSRPNDYKILSGSKEVAVYKSGKNYAWQCPYCGYINEGVGGASVLMEASNHYIGEVSTISGMMICPSFTGCGRSSTYSLTVEWE